MRMKKVERPKKSRAKRRARITNTLSTMSTRTMVIGVLCFLGAAMAIGAATSDVGPDSSAPRAQEHTTTPATPAAPATRASTSVAAVAEPPSVPPPVESKASAPQVAAVTITGCLERNDETFRLKDTSGDYAPKSRSWKTGFLKKASATVDVVDAAKSAKLPSHVGQRVSVTGVLNGREMQVRSLQRLSASCSARG